MGFLEPNRCYKVKARIFRDDPRECTIRWYTIPECSPVFPGWHRFGGRPWLYSKVPPTVGIGELKEAPLVYDKGFPPLRDNSFRGQLDWYRDGMPISALGP